MPQPLPENSAHDQQMEILQLAIQRRRGVLIVLKADPIIAQPAISALLQHSHAQHIVLENSNVVRAILESVLSSGEWGHNENLTVAILLSFTFNPTAFLLQAGPGINYIILN